MSRLYPYEVNAVKNGVCETILVIAASYDSALKELEAEGYAAPEPKDINAMSHKNIIIQKGVEKRAKSARTYSCAGRKPSTKTGC